MQLRDPTCPFCRIAAHEDAAEVIYETPTIIAFVPDQPSAVGHALVIPKDHLPNFLALDPASELTAELWRVVTELGTAIDHALAPDGMNIITSAGEAATQTIFHLHVHLVPRWKDDEIGTIWPPPVLRPNYDEQRVAAEIRREVYGPTS